MLEILKMDTPQTIDILISLAKFELDSARGYEQAVRRTLDEELKVHIKHFYNEHKQHFYTLQQAVVTSGTPFPEQTANLNGFFDNPIRTLQAMKDNKSILQALRLGEKLAVKTYSEALQRQVPDVVRPMLDTILAEEQNHLGAIQEMLTTISAKSSGFGW
jgi:uncharacterized protein (TIGR02284 family)